ncbi:MAG: hypothetical protein ACTS5V_08285, partial [Giesbergeria sp.]
MRPGLLRAGALAGAAFLAGLALAALLVRFDAAAFLAGTVALRGLTTNVFTVAVLVAGDFAGVLAGAFAAVFAAALATGLATVFAAGLAVGLETVLATGLAAGLAVDFAGTVTGLRA